MSGREHAFDGILGLRSDLKDHASGKIPCGTDVMHRARIENFAVCDLRVRFEAVPDGDLLAYGCGATWMLELELPGSSKPRRRRTDSHEEVLKVGTPAAGTAKPVRRDIQVSTAVLPLNPRGEVDGPEEKSVGVRHRLSLT